MLANQQDVSRTKINHIFKERLAFEPEQNKKVFSFPLCIVYSLYSFICQTNWLSFFKNKIKYSSKPLLYALTWLIVARSHLKIKYF